MTTTHVTLKDIARKAGVSTATASLALSGDRRVKEKTRRAVEEAASLLNYVPNEIGRSLRAKKAETIALIFPNTPRFAFSHPYTVHLLQGISEVLVHNHFHLLVSTAPSEADETAAYEKIVRNRRADGIILWPATVRDRHILRILDSGLPVVYLGKWHDGEVATVERDEFGGAYKATEHLLKQGRRRIAHISTPQHYQVSIDRLAGYKSALEDYGIPFDPSMVIGKDFSMESGADAARQLHAGGFVFDAIFGGNDRLAIGAMRALQQLGLSVPHDVAVAGCTNLEMGTITTPALTTIDQPMAQVGTLAAQKLIHMLNGEPLEQRQTLVSPQLIIRGSCGAQ
ncbi:LacI family DNA-binding transcriptional regulator [Paenibacillus hodogayensis]|uniref:LacI family DNA-binding transcriptional regulator n=1 Tax=Paenibacillus hodogayensis TaxID=279208 RepID=A0ABV5VRB2_9BACL